ncbi:MAG TPA: hypothetical protein V6C81_09180 [Planktothrix sp.]
MKKELALAAMMFAALTVQAAHADADWFDRYDHKHSGHWTYDQFRKAHTDWWKHHRTEQRLSDKELHAKFDTLDAEHHGWVTREQARTFHEW